MEEKVQDAEIQQALSKNDFGSAYGLTAMHNSDSIGLCGLVLGLS